MTVNELEKRVDEIAAEQSEMGEAVRYLVTELESLKKLVTTSREGPANPMRVVTTHGPGVRQGIPAPNLQTHKIRTNDAALVIQSDEPQPVIMRETAEGVEEI
jgi:hypothetical protein